MSSTGGALADDPLNVLRSEFDRLYSEEWYEGLTIVRTIIDTINESFLEHRSDFDPVKVFAGIVSRYANKLFLDPRIQFQKQILIRLDADFFELKTYFGHKHNLHASTADLITTPLRLMKQFVFMRCLDTDGAPNAFSQPIQVVELLDVATISYVEKLERMMEKSKDDKLVALEEENRVLKSDNEKLHAAMSLYVRKLDSLVKPVAKSGSEESWTIAPNVISQVEFNIK